MNAADIINEAAAAGVQIAMDGDELSLEASAQPPAAIIDLIAQHKPEIVNLLRPAAIGAAEERISWLDMEVAIDNEAGRHRIWRDEKTRQLAEQNLTAVERDTLQRIIARHAREAAIFEAVSRLIERARTEFGVHAVSEE